MSEAINLKRRIFMDSHGEQFPVVAMFDGNGDECEDENDAVTAVAGTEGRWFCLVLSEFGGVVA